MLQGMKPYSDDLRKRIVRAIEVSGTSKTAAARLFSVSLSSAKRYLRITEQGLSLMPRKGSESHRRLTAKKLLEEDYRGSTLRYRVEKVSLTAARRRQALS